MSAQTVGNAIAVRDTGAGAVVEQYKQEFASLLPEHIKPRRWMASVHGALLRDKQLASVANQNPGSFVVALLDAARLGLEPGTEQYYLTTRKGKNGPEVKGMRGYQGEVELIYRAGAVSSVIVEVVRKDDEFKYTPGRDDRPLHEINWDAEDRGPLRLAYAYAIMKDGATSRVVVLNKHHIAAAKAKSESARFDWSPWQRDEEAMWLKTGAHRLAKWVPTSAEFIREQLRAVADVRAETAAKLTGNPAAATVGGVAPEDDEFGDGIVDGELVDDDAPEADPSEELWREIRQAAPGMSEDDLDAKFRSGMGYSSSNATVGDLRRFLAHLKKSPGGDS